MFKRLSIGLGSLLAADLCAALVWLVVAGPYQVPDRLALTSHRTWQIDADGQARLASQHEESIQ